MSTSFNSLRVEGWRQFGHVEIELHPRLTVLTGANGAGKSSLLRIFTRHFGFSRPFLATPVRDAAGAYSYITGVFTGVVARLWRRWWTQGPDSTTVGSITYQNGIEAQLQIPAQSGVEYQIRHVTFGDIEHVVPKSNDPARWFNWANLTLACDICNTKKSDAPISHETFIDPYDVDPEEHFWHAGAMMYPRPGCDAAALTERLLELNRAELLERREGRVKALMTLLDVVERCANENLKQILWDDFCRETEADKEYAALSRSVVALARAKLGYN